jgi:Vacuolar import and degradation protein
MGHTMSCCVSQECDWTAGYICGSMTAGVQQCCQCPSKWNMCSHEDAGHSCQPCGMGSVITVVVRGCADNVPKVDTPVTTFWEGSIVGVGPHTFVTGQWGADKANDWSHWQK